MTDGEKSSAKSRSGVPISVRTRVIVGDCDWIGEPAEIFVSGQKLVLREPKYRPVGDSSVCYSEFHRLPNVVEVEVRKSDGRSYSKYIDLERSKTLVISAIDPVRTGFIPSERWEENLFDD